MHTPKTVGMTNGKRIIPLSSSAIVPLVIDESFLNSLVRSIVRNIQKEPTEQHWPKTVLHGCKTHTSKSMAANPTNVVVTTLLKLLY